jgi:uncharacterized protein YabE (DUF348 family)
VGGGGDLEGRTHLFAVSARVGWLALVTGVVGVGTLALIGPTAGKSTAVVATRAAPAPRGVLGVESGPLTVSVDGLAATVRVPSRTVGEALRGLGLAQGSGDRLSTPAGAAVLPGQRVALDRGLPVTLIDGGREVASRSVRGTVADLLAASAIVLGPLDQLDQPLGAWLNPGDVVRVMRIVEEQVTILEEIPFRVQLQPDPSLDRLRQIVVTPGQPGRVENTYFVRVVDGRETERALLGSEVLAIPMTEVRRVGTRTPPAPAEIEAVIRDAAAAQGADAEQLLRVAYCESRFNPGAYNATSGASGLFQFLPSTWSANSVRAGFGGASVWDPVASANVAAYMFAMGQSWQWSCR